MIYTLNFIDKFGLWELQVNNCRARFFTSRYGAERLIARYRQMLQSEQDRYEAARFSALTPTEKLAEFERYDQ